MVQPPQTTYAISPKSFTVPGGHKKRSMVVGGVSHIHLTRNDYGTNTLDELTSGTAAYKVIHEASHYLNVGTK